FVVITAFQALSPTAKMLLTPPKPADQFDEEDVDMVTVSAKEWDSTHAPEPPAAAAKAAAKPAPEVKKEALPTGQVVDVAAGNDQKPTDSAYLAEHDNTVAKETRARETTPFYGKAMPKQTQTQPNETKEQAAKLKGNQGTGTEDKTKAEKVLAAEKAIPKSETKQKVATLERSEDGETSVRGTDAMTSGFASRLQLRPGALFGQQAEEGSEGKAGTPDAPEETHAAGAPAEAVGAAPNDFLNKVPIGDGTFLNTREFKYASFINRVKQRVGEVWRPNDTIGPRHRSSRNITTMVDVSLDEKGHVVNIEVSQPSGESGLDDEAVAAFQRAQPFPNPPAGLFDSDHLIHLRFGFVLDNLGRVGSPFGGLRGL
ncbi:MAG TPA: TonB family protein, partial [Polyangia bacterium]|nr:TonB family protein [Polyangia bacterium]